MFNIPISQLCPAGLHISLGTYLKCFNILEDEAQCLDLKIAEKNGESLGSCFTNIRTQIKTIYSSIEDKEQKIDLVRDAAANAIPLHSENEQQIKLVYEPRLKFLGDQISEELGEIEHLKKFFFFFFMHFFSGTKHPREDNPNLYYWAEITGLHTQTFNI